MLISVVLDPCIHIYNILNLFKIMMIRKYENKHFKLKDNDNNYLTFIYIMFSLTK